MDIRLQMQITNFFLTITEWDRHIELTRQFLNAMESFEPYAAYLRLNGGSGEPITPEDLDRYLKENGFNCSLNHLRTVVQMFDSRLVGSLDFEDFLKMILSRDNPDLRFNAVSNPTYEVDDGQKLSDQIEYTLAQFFVKAGGFIDRISRDPEIQSVLSKPNLFDLIDYEKTGALDFENLQDLFGKSKILLRETELISILRVIDINDDGLIDSTKFKFFLSLCQGMEPSPEVIQDIRSRNQDTEQSNYFGELAKAPEAQQPAKDQRLVEMSPGNQKNIKDQKVGGPSKEEQDKEKPQIPTKPVISSANALKPRTERDSEFVSSQRESNIHEDSVRRKFITRQNGSNNNTEVPSLDQYNNLHQSEMYQSNYLK